MRNLGKSSAKVARPLDAAAGQPTMGIRCPQFSSEEAPAVTERSPGFDETRSAHMLWDLMQQRQIGRATAAASQAASSISRTETDIAELERVIESLTLTCQAMWELLREQSKLTDEALLQRIQEVDLRDGRRDGRIGTNAATCPACSRPNNSRHTHCVYCGGVLPPSQHVFG
jgi:hypothetical protein